MNDDVFDIKPGTILIQNEGPVLDVSFNHALILIIGTDEGYHMGLNIASRLMTPQDFENDSIGLSGRVYLGGPVGEAVPSFYLSKKWISNPRKCPQKKLVRQDMGFAYVQNEDQLQKFLDDKTPLFLGYAGWGPDQLEAEIKLFEEWTIAPPSLALDKIMELPPEQRFFGPKRSKQPAPSDSARNRRAQINPESVLPA